MAKQCLHCGGTLEENARFCVLCGGKVEEPVPQAVPTSPQPVQQTTIQQQAPVAQQPAPAAQPMNLSYPTGNEAQQTQSEILVPSGANIDIGAMKDEEAPTFQSMPEISSPQQPVMPQTQPMVPHSPEANAETIKKKKKKKKKSDAKIIFIIAGIVGSIFILLLVIVLASALLSMNESDPSTKKTELTEKNSYRVGSKDFGYVSVPNSWSPFGVNEANQTIQYSDGAGWIVTLFSVDKTTIEAKDWANSIVNQMSSVGASEIGIEPTKINKYSGYKIFGYYSSVKTFLAAWVIEGNDGKNHYIAIEGPNRYDNNYDIVYTFNTEK